MADTVETSSNGGARESGESAAELAEEPHSDAAKDSDSSSVVAQPAVPAQAPAAVSRRPSPHREIVDKVKASRDAGCSADEMADQYEQLAAALHARDPGWRAERARCEDGCHVFIGNAGPALVITPSRRILFGTWTINGRDPNAMFDVIKLRPIHGRWYIERPDLSKATREE